MRTNPSHTYRFIKYLKLLHRSKEPGYLFLQGDQSFVSLKNARPLSTHLIMSAATTLLPLWHLIFYLRGFRADQWLHEADSPVRFLLALRNHFSHPHCSQLAPPPN